MNRLVVVLLTAFSLDALAAPLGGVTSSTVVGLDQIVQSVRGNRRFAEPKAKESFFLKKRPADPDLKIPPDQPDSAHLKPTTEETAIDLSTVSWDLAYAYAHPSLPSGSTKSFDQHVGLLGIQWEASPSVTLATHLGMGMVPSYDYQRGQIALRVEYHRSLPVDEWLGKRVSSAPKLDEKDARTYFRERLKPPPPPSEDDPVLSVGLNMAVDQHQLKSATGATSTLSQLMTQVDLGMKWKQGLSARVSGAFFGYSNRVSSFVSTLTLPSAASYLLPGGSLTGIASQFLNFPFMVFEQSATYQLTPTWSLGAHVNQVIPMISSWGVSFAAIPETTFLLWESWKLGVGAGMALPAKSGASVAVLGVVNLSFIF